LRCRSARARTKSAIAAARPEALATGPNSTSPPSAMRASMPSTLWTMLPYSIEREPHELLPAMPPIVACALVETSTGNQRPVRFSAALRSSRTRPGSTSAVRRSRSTATILRKCLVASMTSAAPVVCPHWLVPAPRGSTGTRSSRAIASAAATSPSLVGTKAPAGKIW
jgi:hypothetical protein